MLTPFRASEVFQRHPKTQFLVGVFECAFTVTRERGGGVNLVRYVVQREGFTVEKELLVEQIAARVHPQFIGALLKDLSVKCVLQLFAAAVHLVVGHFSAEGERVKGV